MTSLIKFGQFVKYARTQKGITQKELAIKVFGCQRQDFIGRLERNKLNGISFATVDRIMVALDSELEFREYEK